MTFKNGLIVIITRYPYRILLANLLLIAVIGGGISQLFVDSGTDIFFSEDDPNLLAERQLNHTYGREENILFIIDAAGGDIFTHENLETIAAITEQGWQMPNSRRVDSVTNYLYPEVDGDDIRIDALVEDAAALKDADITRVRDIALSQRALLGRLIAQDGKVAAVNVSLNLKQNDMATAIANSVQFAREIAFEAERANPSLAIHLAGTALTEQTLTETVARDSVTLMPLLFALVLVILALLLRSVLASVCAVATIFLSVLVGMGFAGWTGIGINSVNVSAPTIIMTLAIADCIHILTVFLRQLRINPNKQAALTTSLQHTLYPVTLTSLTTAIGFLSMTFSESPPFRELGIISAVGVIGALWVSVTILPGLILLLPFKPGKSLRTGLPMDGLARFVIRRHKGVFWISLLFILSAISFIPRLELNDDPNGYFSSSIPLSQAIKVIEDRLSGTQSLHYSLNAGQVGAIADPRFLHDVDQFVDWLRAQPEVTNVESFTDTLKRLNQVMHDDASHWHRLPDSRELTSQYILLYEISVPYGQDVTHQISADKSSLKISATLKNQKSQGLIEFEERGRRWMAVHTPKLATARGVSQSISFANVGLRNIHSMLSGSLFAILLISLCLVFAFRSIRFGLVSLIPNLFPALVTLGIWGAVVGEVNIAASVVFSLTLGIIVDDTTHFLVNYLESRRTHGLSTEEAIINTFSNVGSALLSTSIVLAIGFLILVQSDFSVNSTSGLLVAMTISIAILLDLFFLPTVLIKADSWLVSPDD